MSEKKEKTSAHRRITIEFRGQRIPALAKDGELVGLLAGMPKGTGHPDWKKAVEKALKG